MLEEEALIVAFRRHTQLPLDDCSGSVLDLDLIISNRQAKLITVVF
jgi:hypothetical protein